jgi:hypothetical protein
MSYARSLRCTNIPSAWKGNPIKRQKLLNCNSHGNGRLQNQLGKHWGENYHAIMFTVISMHYTYSTNFRMSYV